MRVIGVNNFSVTELNVSLSEMFATGSLAIPIVFVYSGVFPLAIFIKLSCFYYLITVGE